MIDTKELRSMVEENGKSGIDLEEIHEILDRLEAAEKAVTEAYQRGYLTGQEEIEKERDALRAENEALAANLRGKHSITGAAYAHLIAERDALQAKVEAMEKQKPVATVRINAINGNPSVDFVPGHRYLHHNDKLYLAPGAKGE